MTALSVRRAARSELSYVLGAALVLRVIGLFWGLPASDGWDNDGVAPRDFLPGLVESFTPGHFFTYPPAHLALLSVLTLPVTVFVLAHARSLSPADVIATAIQVPYMTAYAVVARVVSVAMSIGIAYAVARLAEEVFGRRAGILAAAAASVNVLMTYYAHATNLDVPYLFWGSFALLALTRAIARNEPPRLRGFAVLAALAVATKDQAYALFLLGAPLALFAWVAFDAWPRAHARAVLREAAVAAAIGIGLWLVVDGVLFNPSGFLARVRFLTGPASQPFAYYSADAYGRFLVVADSFTRFDTYYPVAFAAFVLVGVGRAFGKRGGARAAAFVPLLAAASFTLLFNCTARRTENRFLLPQMTLWAVYAGAGLETWLAVRVPWRWFAWGTVIVLFAWAVFRCADVDANLLLDPRYDAEAWLFGHVAPGDTIEIHGKNVYLLRLPSEAHAVRVGPDPIAQRSRLPNVEEKEDLLTHVGERAPRWIVVSEGYAGQYLLEVHVEPEGASGRIYAGTQVASSRDTDARLFFRGLLAGGFGYALAHTSTFTSRFWQPADIHGSLSRPVWIFERVSR